jgi:hypothetical protein
VAGVTDGAAGSIASRFNPVDTRSRNAALGGCVSGQTQHSADPESSVAALTCSWLNLSALSRVQIKTHAANNHRKTKGSATATNLLRSLRIQKQRSYTANSLDASFAVSALLTPELFSLLRCLSDDGLHRKSITLIMDGDQLR